MEKVFSGAAATKRTMILSIAKKVLQVEADAIRELIPRLDSNFEKTVELLYQSKGRVVTTGMGKSGIICKKIAATLSSTGTPALFIHPAEAVHGDLGMLVSGDILLAVSNSGETEEILALLERVKRLDVKLISMVGSSNSTLAKHSDIALDVSVDQEACPLGLSPTASTTAALALGDAIALALLEMRGFKEEDFALLHPGGKIGKRYLKVKDLMHTGTEIPKVHVSSTMSDVVYEMSKKGLGVTSVVSAGELLRGVITDGDLRRMLQKKGDILDRTAGECMTANPVTIDREELATRALNLMETKKITSLLIVNKRGQVDGIIHLHDLWGTQMF